MPEHWNNVTFSLSSPKWHHLLRSFDCLKLWELKYLKMNHLLKYMKTELKSWQAWFPLLYPDPLFHTQQSDIQQYACVYGQHSFACTNQASACAVLIEACLSIS